MRLWLLCALVLAAPSVRAEEKAPPIPQRRLAVLEFDLGGGVQIDRLYFSDKVRGVVGKRAPHLFVMTRESTEAILQGFGQSLSDCTGECEVEIGRKLNADYVVGGRITKVGSRLSLTLKLYSTTEGRLLGTEEAIGKDVDELVDATASAVTPLLTPLEQKAQSLVASVPAPIPLPTVNLDLVTDPPGAAASVDGQLRCASTPCRVTVKEGKYLVAVQKDGYQKAERALTVKEDAQVSVKLVQLVAGISVNSSPAGLAVSLDGKSAGKTPLVLHDQNIGQHTLVIDDPCFVSEAVQVDLKAAENRVVSLAPKPRTTPVQLVALDESGAALKGEASADGSSLGQAPGSYKVPVCTKAVRVRVDQAAAVKTVKLAEGKSAALSLTVPVARCSKVRGWNTGMGWLTGVTLVAGAGGMGGAVALQQTARNAPAGDSSTHSKIALGKTLNIVGLAALGVGAAGLLTYLILPNSAAACEVQTP